MLNQFNKRQDMAFKQKQFDVENQQRQQQLDMAQQRLGMAEEDQAKQNAVFEQAQMDRERGDMIGDIKRDAKRAVPWKDPRDPSQGLQMGSMPRPLVPEPANARAARMGAEGRMEQARYNVEHGFTPTGQQIRPAGGGSKGMQTVEDIKINQMKKFDKLRTIGPYSIKELNKADPTLVPRAVDYQIAKADTGTYVDDQTAIATVKARDNIDNVWAQVTDPNADVDPETNALAGVINAIRKRSNAIQSTDTPLWKGRTVAALVPELGDNFDTDQAVDLEDIAREAEIEGLDLVDVLNRLFANQMEFDKIGPSLSQRAAHVGTKIGEGLRANAMAPPTVVRR
jgi:hypothetical protein